MIKILFYIFIITTTSFASQINNPLQLTSEELAYLKEKKVLNVSADANYPPYDFVVNGTPTGYSTQYVELLGEKLGIKLNFVIAKSWKETLEKFCAKEIDLLHATDFSEVAKKCGNFSIPQIRDNRLIVTRKNGFQKISSSDDLVGYTMVTPKGWSNEAIYRKRYGDKIKYIKSKDIQEALEFIRQGKADFTTASSNALQYFILKNGYENLILYPNDLNKYDNNNEKSNLYIASRNDAPYLLSIINKAMSSVSILEKKKLREKWFGVMKESNPLLTTKEKEYLRQKDTIRYCIDPLWKPIDFIDKDGLHSGVGALFVKDIEIFLDKKLLLVPTKTWKETLQKVKNRECDMVSLIQKTDARAKYLNFSQVYLSKENVIVTKKDVSYIDNLRTLKNKKIGVVNDYYIEEKLKQKYENLEIIEFDSIFEGLKAVEKGELFGFVDITPVLAHMILEKGMNLKISGEAKLPIELSFGIIKEESELVPVINKALQNISSAKKIEYANLYTNLVQQKTDYDLVWKIVIATILLLSMIGYWNRKLAKAKKEIEQKNKELDKLLLIQSRQATFGTMIDTISHQWKQPLNELGLQMMYLDAQLKFEGKVPSKEILEETIDKSNHILEFMSQTIDIFRNFFKTSNEISNVNISEVTNNTLLFLESTFETLNITINKNIEPRITIQALEEEFAHSILNILVNAKDIFGYRGITSPTISIELYKKENGNIIISIEDNGGGIRIEPIEKIFESKVSEKTDGGIGLFISKKIIEEKLNSTIEVENTKNGAKFTIIF